MRPKGEPKPPPVRSVDIPPPILEPLSSKAGSVLSVSPATTGGSRTRFDRAAYQRNYMKEYMRRYRAKAKDGK